MAQALSNLVSNGLAYGDPGKPVRVSSSEQGADEVRVTVANEGPPIPLRAAPGLVRAVHARDEREVPRPGWGSGLYIVKQIVVAHHGTIAVESSAPGRDRVHRLFCPARSRSIARKASVWTMGASGRACGGAGFELTAPRMPMTLPPQALGAAVMSCGAPLLVRRVPLIEIGACAIERRARLGI